MSLDVTQATEHLLVAALRVLSAERGSQDDPHWGAEQEYAGEQLALAARELAGATDALPTDKHPIGWEASND